MMLLNHRLDTAIPRLQLILHRPLDRQNRKPATSRKIAKPVMLPGQLSPPHLPGPGPLVVVLLGSPAQPLVETGQPACAWVDRKRRLLHDEPPGHTKETRHARDADFWPLC